MYTRRRRGAVKFRLWRATIRKMPRKRTAGSEAIHARPSGSQSLYDGDYYSWALTQARALRGRHSEQLDWINLAEEVEDLASRNADALQSQAERLISHLLKIALAPPRLRQENLRIWELSVRDARRRIRTILKKNPGLKPRASELFSEAWPGGRDQALAATGMPDEAIPENPCWTFEQVIREDFTPKTVS
jgi:hypothetical protein